MTDVLRDIVAERRRQDEKWGPSDSRPIPSLDVLVEEVGEVARALCDREPVEDLRTELVQVAAVACAMVEGIDRGQSPNPSEFHGTSSRDRHPLSERYHELLATLGDLHDRKQSDYGRENDPFANVRASEEWGMPGWVGALIRATDKIRRLQTLAIRGELSNESALDAFDDLAVYAVIGRVLYEEHLETLAAQARDEETEV